LQGDALETRLGPEIDIDLQKSARARGNALIERSGQLARGARHERQRDRKPELHSPTPFDSRGCRATAVPAAPSPAHRAREIGAASALQVTARACPARDPGPALGSPQSRP